MDARLHGPLGAALGGRVVAARRIVGGDINDAFEVTLGDGRRVFVKTNARAPAGMFEAEAHGLAWLREAGALRVPAVLASSGAWTELGSAERSPSRGGAGTLGGLPLLAAGAPPFLALELVRTTAPAAGFDEALGRGLAALHRRGAVGFGLGHGNFIGRLPQDNTVAATWPEFYRARRLEAQLRRAADDGLASARMRRGFDRLFGALDDLVGPPEPPARLHGDLWGGNVLCDERGAPCLIDPAVYGGHREIDLAMMRLFGGFGARVFDAYDEAWPLADGHQARVALYQLYPLMVHVNLFGGGYVSSVESALDRLA